ncbi:MAG: hypothetical protein AAGK23_09485 [Pseudomonadota bacterium]
MKTFSAILALTVTVAAQMATAAAQDYISEQKGDFSLQLNAPAGSGSLEAVVNDTKTQSIAYYSGNCSADAKVMLVVGDPSALQTHYASGDPKDLKADAILNEFGQLIERGCPDIQTISVFPTHLPSQVAAITLSRSANWSMDDGAIPDRFRPRIALSQLLNVAMTPGGMECNDPADILMDGTQPGARAERFQVYRRAAKDGAILHEFLCPGTTLLRFHPVDHPAGLVCNADDGQCYLQVTWNSNVTRVIEPRPTTQQEIMQRLPEMMSGLGEGHENWRVEAVGYIEDPALAAPKIRTAQDMVDYLARGDLDLVRNQYSNYFRVFHNQFLFAYSQQCSASVVDPVTFDVTPIEETIYGDGSRSGPRQTGETYQLTLDRKFEDTYIRWENANRLWLTSQAISTELDLRSSRGGGAGITSVVGWVMSDKAEIDVFIRQGCDAERVQTVYQSLERVL